MLDPLTEHHVRDPERLAWQRSAGWWGRGLPRTWSDGKKQRVEVCLNKFLVATCKAAVCRKADRIERERQKREWVEQERRRAILRKQIEQEQKRLDVFTEQMKAWQEARQLRDCVAAVRRAGCLPPAYDHGWTGY